MTDGLYIYGLAAAGTLQLGHELPGIEGTRAVRCLTHGEICALVSDVSLEQFQEEPLREHLADMSWVERIARTHQRVLDAVLDQTTPIPMRLCTVYRDERGLRDMLDREHSQLTAALTELSGKLEWGVQIFAPASGTAESRPATPTSGTAYLQSRLTAREATELRQSELERTCERLHAQLCELSCDCRVGVPQSREASAHDAPMILNAFHLVDNARRDEFGARVHEIGEQLTEQGIELRLTGPWAPYNFIPVATGGRR